MILVLGMGVTGLSVVKALHKNKHKFIIADSRDIPPLLNKFNEFCSKIYTGQWCKDILIGVNKIIISPGINPNENIVVWAKIIKIEIITDIDLFYQYIVNTTNAKLIAVTASNGKSTVVKMLTDILCACNIKAVACGNIGLPVLDALNHKIEIYVIELSSYQLDYIKNIKLDLALVLNITPDHLDRYKNFQQYMLAKLKIYSFSKKNLINADEKYTKNIHGPRFSVNNIINDLSVISCSDNKYFICNKQILFSLNDTKFIGRHNIENILAVLNIIVILNLSLLTAINVIKNFSPLKHRLEFINNFNGKDYFNDSKATNATSCICAIKAMFTRYNTVTLILGGTAKKESYEKLFNLINTKVSNTIIFGMSSKFFAQHINTTIKVNTLDEAIIVANKFNAKVVLFSPACASFDMFDNFSHRGQEFKKSLQRVFS